MRLGRPAGLAIAVGIGVLLCAGGSTVVGSAVVGRGLPPSRDALRGTGKTPRLPSLGPHVALVDEYCLSCHDKDHEKGKLVLETIAEDSVAEHPEVWEKVVRKLRARLMPPVGKERPDEPTYDTVVAFLEKSLDRASVAQPNPGRTATIRRLTRTEYKNAIRDLLALDVDVASLLPADDSSYGFDNVTVGDLSPTLLERYISAAEKISRLAVGGPSRSPGGETIRIPPDLTQEEHLEGLPIGTHGGVVVPYTFPQN